MTLANEQNLIPAAHKLTVEEASRGGKASVAARRERKAVQETARAVLDMPLKPGEFLTADEIESIEQIKGANITVKDAALFAQAKKAVSGDTKALELLIAAAGEKPAEKLEINADVEKARARIMELVGEVDKELSDNGGNE